ncbi:MAG: hypothetical protein KME31_02305 [Tolypothrix carrinoi HA7290-LM1]|jgi:hypothetical protein|nr:hypothetical protein [Tolypothrix carrinoi HA7290-LM1]
MLAFQFDNVYAEYEGLIIAVLTCVKYIRIVGTIDELSKSAYRCVLHPTPEPLYIASF